MAQILDCFRIVLTDTLDGKLTEQSLFEVNNYGKVVVAIDEMMPEVIAVSFYLCSYFQYWCVQGIVENFDAELIIKLSKMKSLT